jgi:site-specific recombinase XerD
MRDLADPFASLRRYMAAEKADATRAAYEKGFADFKRFCEAAGDSALPAEPITVGRYAANLADRGIKASTIGQRLNAISYVHKCAGLASPTLNDGVRAVIRGIRRKIGVKPNRKAPATAELIAKMVQAAPDSPIGLRDKALLLLAFAAALRRSELVALDVEHVEIEPEGARVFIARSKTDQAAEGYTISVPAGSKLRPVAALQAWIERAGITSGPLFREVDRHGNVEAGRLSGRSIARIVKRAARRAGLDERVFSGHSMRTGFVTSALEGGADVLKIMDVTRHKGLRQLKVYDRRARGFRDHAGKDFL